MKNGVTVLLCVLAILPFATALTCNACLAVRWHECPSTNTKNCSNQETNCVSAVGMGMNTTVNSQYVMRDCLNCSVVGKSDCDSLNETAKNVYGVYLKTCYLVSCCTSSGCNTQTPEISTQSLVMSSTQTVGVSSTQTPGVSTPKSTAAARAKPSASLLHGLVCASLMFSFM